MRPPGEPRAIDLAIADGYKEMALARCDMRAATDALEQLRVELEGGEPTALDRVDDVIALAGQEARPAAMALATAAEAVLLSRVAEHRDGGWPGALAALARAAAALRGDHIVRLWNSIAADLGELPDELQSTLGLDRQELNTAVVRMRAARWGGCARVFRRLAAITDEPRCRAALLIHAAAVALYFHVRPARARGLLDEAAAVGSGMSRLSSGRGNLAFEVGDLAAAEEHYRQALRLAASERPSDRADTLVNLGDFELRRGRASEALIHYDDALRASPGAASAINSIISLAGSPGMYEGLRSRLSEMVSRSLGLDSAAATRATLAAADACWRAEARTEAHRWNAELERLEGGPAHAAAQRGQWALADQTPAAAVVHFARAVELEPDLAEAWRQLALAHLAGDDVGAAEVAAAKLAAVDPDHFAAVTLPGAIAAARGDVETAKRCLTAAVAAEPNSAATVGLIEHATLRFTGAAEIWLRDFLATVGRLGVAATHWNQEGNRVWANREVAVTAYRKAEWYEPSAVILRNLALALTDLRRFDDARLEIDRAETLAITDDDRVRSRDVRARIENDTGNLCVERGDLLGAVGYYSASLEHDPDDPVVWANLAEAHERTATTGDPVAALEQARRARTQALALRPGHGPDRARILQLDAKLALLTEFGQRGLGIPEPPPALSAELAADLLPAFVDDANHLRPAITEQIEAHRAAVTARHGLSLPGIQFRIADLPAGRFVLAVHGTAAVIPTEEEPVAAFGHSLGLLKGCLHELIGHDVVARALADAKVALPPDRDVLTAATQVARAFLEEDVALEPVSEWAAALLAAWAARPPNLIALIEAIRAASGIRGRLPGNQPETIRIQLEPTLSADLRAQIASVGHAVALPLTALQPAMAWIRDQVSGDGRVRVVVVDSELRYVLSRTLALTGGAVAVASPDELDNTTPLPGESA